MPPQKILENIVILCFEGRFTKQNVLFAYNHTFCPPPIFGLATSLIRINPSFWTINRSFEVILEMGTVYWIGHQTQCSVCWIGLQIQ